MTPALSADPSEPTLDELLDRMSRVAELYASQALSFTCDETIHHHTHAGRVDHRFRYVYVFRDDEGLQDYRVPRKKSQKKQARQSRADLADYGLPSALLRAYTWAFIFGERQHEWYRYELLSEDEVLGRPAIRIGFSGRPPIELGRNDWIGTAWADRETYQLLRVDAMKEPDYRARERYRNSFTGGEAATIPRSWERIETDFGVVKNGMRFPSEVRIERKQYSIYSPEGSRLYLVRQAYKNYRFFSVLTEAQVERAVLADSP